MPIAMTAHPRLYVSAQQLAMLDQPVQLPALREAQRHVARSADAYARTADVDYPRDTHNEHLIRARIMQTRIVTLLARYAQTQREHYRAAALRDVATMGRWEYWSWITWRQGNNDPNAIFDLSYGENSATLAMAYDWLHDSLGEDERKLFLDIARRRSLTPFLKHTPGSASAPRQWWYKSPASNWNTVCAGGAGMLALAMYEELPEARQALPRVERSIRPYMHNLAKLDGAWPEGIGYWNYGMRYAFMYLLSHERATGKAHPLIEQEATRKTLFFPMDFTPNGVSCSFGDVNHWSPLPFHFAMAQRLGEGGLVRQLMESMSGKPTRRETWPNAAEALLLVPRAKPRRAPTQRNVAKRYGGQDWMILADRMPQPKLYLSIRGGTTEVPHGHRDLLSYHAVVGDEAMITNIGINEYLDTTFSPRRFELFEAGPTSKNTLLIGGVGITGQTQVKTTDVTLGTSKGYHLDASNCFGTMRDGAATDYCARLFLLLGGALGPAALILDTVELPHTGRIESRLHTLTKVTLGEATAQLKGRRQGATLAWACNVPAELLAADAPLTSPGPLPRMLRWRTRKLHTRVVMATLLVPGAAGKNQAAVELDLNEAKLGVTVHVKGKTRKLTLSPRLMPLHVL